MAAWFKRRLGSAGVVELVDTLDLGSSGLRRGGSNPSARTTVGEFSAIDERDRVTIETGDARGEWDMS